MKSQLDAALLLEHSAPAWLRDARRAARLAFETVGLPGPRDEPWKYTSLKALEGRAPIVGDVGASGRSIALDGALLDAAQSPRMVFVNGTFRADLSRLDDLPAGVELAPLSSVLDGGHEIARPIFTAAFDDRGAGLARLNTALARDGVWLRIAADTALVDPIHLLFVGADAGTDIAWHLRHAIELEAGASASVIEQYIGDSASPQVGNVVEHLQLGSRACLRHVRLQEAPLSASLFSRSEVRLAEGALLESVVLELGAGLARRDVRVRLEGPGARLDARGATALRARQHLDAQYEVRHVARDTRSEVRWRAVADERARAVFGGAIVVEAGADGADAQLSNKNLLLSPHAEIDSRPVLEIHADEVKAAHGATVGRLDDNALFYLRSRGVPEVQARTLLTYAFCAEALSGVVPESLQAQLGARLAAHLPQQPGVEA